MGDAFYIDIVDPQAAFENLKNRCAEKEQAKKGNNMLLPAYEEKAEIISMNSIDETQGFCSRWPFVVFKGMNDNLLIFNVNEKERVNRVQLPGYLIRVNQTYISQVK